MRKIVVVLILLFFGLISNSAALGDNKSQSSQIEEILTNLRSYPDKGKRDFYTLVKNKELWGRLNENDKNRLKDAFSNYLMKKIKVVYKLKKEKIGMETDPFENVDCIIEELQDPRFIPILLEGQSKGVCLIEILKRYREDVIFPLAKKFWKAKDGKERLRLTQAMRRTLGYIDKPISIESQKEIKSILLACLEDTYAPNRISAIVTIRVSIPLLSDYQEFIPILQKIAKEAPYPHHREEAQKVLKKLTDNVSDEIMEVIGGLKKYPDWRKNKVGTEGEGEYFGELMEKAGRLKDPRAIPALLNCLDQRLAANSLILIGIESIPGLIKAMENSDRAVRANAAFAIGEIFSKSTSTQLTSAQLLMKNELKRILIRELKDKEWMVRKNVIHALGYFPDADVIPIIKKIAKEDPYFQDFSKKENYTGPKIRYPVREEAEKILDKLKKEGKIKE